MQRIVDGEMRELVAFGIRKQITMPVRTTLPDGSASVTPTRPMLTARQAVVQFADGDVFVFHERRGKLLAVTGTRKHSELCVQQHDALGLVLPVRLVTLRIVERASLRVWALVVLDETGTASAPILWVSPVDGEIEWHPRGRDPTWLAQAIESGRPRDGKRALSAARQCVHGEHWARCDACDRDAAPSRTVGSQRTQRARRDLRALERRTSLVNVTEIE